MHSFCNKIYVFIRADLSIIIWLIIRIHLGSLKRDTRLQSKKMSCRKDILLAESIQKTAYKMGNEN